MMKKFILLLLALLGMTAGLQAANTGPVGSSPVGSKATEAKAAPPVYREVPASKPYETDTLMTADQFISAKKKAVATPRRASARRATTMSQLVADDYVISCLSITAGRSATGGSTAIKQLSGDSILISNFYEGDSVKAAVDFSTGEVTIPCQTIYTHEKYGDIKIAAVNTKGVPQWKETIKGHLTDDGISIDSWWMICLTDGRFFYAGYNTHIVHANGKMAVTRVIPTQADTTQLVWNVILKQEGDNLVTVKNWGDHGLTVDVVLNPDGTVEVDKQAGWYYDRNLGTFYVVGVRDWANDQSQYVPLAGTVNASLDTLSFGNWSLTTSDGHYTGQMLNATITGLKVKLPVFNTTKLEGSGTKTDPYLIKTRDDLVYLAIQVNKDINLDYFDGDYRFAKSYLGKYVKLVNDIDMTGYRFTPIGRNFSHRFAGNFDGCGHTLTGLNVKQSTGYAGLFGICDTAAVIKNLNVTQSHVESLDIYCGTVVGKCEGTLDNVHVTEGNVFNIGGATGGVAAVANDATNCSYSGAVQGLGGQVAGLFSEAYGEVTKCHATARVTTSGGKYLSTGGLIGILWGNYSYSKAVVTDCYFVGTVSGRYTAYQNLGGLVGCSMKGKIKRCFASARVVGYVSKVGGIVGQLMGSQLSDCYATGVCFDTLSTAVGGITGHTEIALSVADYVRTTFDTLQCNISNCYSACTIEADTTGYDPSVNCIEALGSNASNSDPVINNVYFDSQIADKGSTQHRALTRELTSAAGIAGFSTDTWVFTQGVYPRLKGIDNTPEARFASSAVVFDSTTPDHVDYVSTSAKFNLLGQVQAALRDGSGHHVKAGNATLIAADSLKLNGNFGTDELALYDSTQKYFPERLFTLTVAPRSFEGQGTAVSPFLIKTKSDLIKLCDITSRIGQNYPHVYFKQTADIDLEKSTDFYGISSVAKNRGQESRSFAGIYDGDGHTIHNMLLEWVTWATKPTATTLGSPMTTGSRSVPYKGFIGQLAPQGVVKNLTLAADCDITLWSESGAIVGYNHGTVDNCRNYANVLGLSSRIGGIVGLNADKGVITNCYNAGTIKGGNGTVGGIVGYLTGHASGCMNTGDVLCDTASTYQQAPAQLVAAGGIAGICQNGDIDNCLNAGKVQAHGKTGGIMGQAVNQIAKAAIGIHNSLNYGTVWSSEAATSGAVSGSAFALAGKAENVYYDGQTLSLKAAGAGARDGMTPSLTATLTSGKPLQGLDADTWSYAAGRYPIIKRFVGAWKAQEASKVVLYVAGGRKATSMTGNATLSAATWKLSQGDYFTLSDTILQVPSPVNGRHADVLTGTIGDFSRPIRLQAIPPVPLAGLGTQESPYLITSPHDWDAVANYVAEVGYGFDGDFLQITNDISFGDTTFVSWMATGNTEFEGTLDGAGHTIKTLRLTTTGVVDKLGSIGTIQNLTLKGRANPTSEKFGAWSRVAYGTFQNCHNKIALKARAAYCAAFAGQAGPYTRFISCTNDTAITTTMSYCAPFVADCDQPGLSFTDCVNNGTVKCTGTSTQGLAGFTASSKGVDYTRCVNNGAITASGDYVAGIQAKLDSGSPVTLTQCYNTAAIAGSGNVAGLVSDFTHSGYGTLTECYNTGDVTGHANVGGLLNLMGSGTHMSHCWNSGNVTNVEGSYTGGLWGSAVNSADGRHAVITACYNTGNVTGKNDVAGLGYMCSYTTIDSCYNTGNITGTGSVCGIGSFWGVHDTMTRCWNSGTITGTNSSQGGLCASAGFATTMSECFNVGNVTGGNATGGLVGNGHVAADNCYNTGDVTGSAAVGGLCGTPSVMVSDFVATSFNNCYNLGKITCTGNSTSSVGNIIGSTDKDSWDQYNTITSTYYVTDFNGTLPSDAKGGTAVTIKQLAAMGDMPGNWDCGDDYTLPMITGFCHNDAAKAHAAAVVVADGDTYDHVTGTFWVGLPEGVAWSFNSDAIDLKDDIAYVTRACNDTVLATVTCGDFSHTWQLKLDVTSGIDDNLAQKPIVSRTYYNVAGQQSQVPFPGINIVVTRYSDGTTTSRKVVK